MGLEQPAAFGNQDDDQRQATERHVAAEQRHDGAVVEMSIYQAKTAAPAVVMEPTNEAAAPAMLPSGSIAMALKFAINMPKQMAAAIG